MFTLKNLLIFVLIFLLAFCFFLIILKCLNRINHHSSSIGSRVENNHIKNLEKEIIKLQKVRNKYKEELQKISNFDSHTAKIKLKYIIDEELEEYKNKQINEITNEINENKNTILKKIILETMQPIHLDIINETSIHHIKVDEKIKALIVGKKGQNIKKLCEITGCNIDIKRGNEYIEISCPNPYDKQIAINVINHLIKSNAFDLIAINNVYKKEKNLIDNECLKIGKDCLNELGITIENEKLFNYIGRLRYRWSFNQNVLFHCKETALICEKLANNFGLNPQIAKEVGFFHDIGKSIDYQENIHDHVKKGLIIAEECNLSKEVVNAIAKHHWNKNLDDYVMLAKCADAWSAARIGARHVPEANNLVIKKLVYEKVKKINDISSLKIQVEQNNIYIIFVPKIHTQQNYNVIKFNIINSIKSDIRLKKFKIIIDDSLFI